MIKDILKGGAKLIGNAFSGGLVGEIVDIVDKKFPDKMSEKERAEIEIAVTQLTHKREIELLNAWNEQEKNFQDFVSEHEGTASDLKNVRFIGPLIILLRGAFRPLFAYTTAYINIMVFSGSWTIDDPQLMSLLYAISLVVFSFYYGERAVKNVMPIIGAYFGKGANGSPNKTNAIG